MSYGNGKERKDWELRAMPLGVGKLSAAKKARLLAIRNSILSLMEDMLARCFVDEPLYAKHSQKTIDAMLFSMEKEHKGVNAVWKQLARMQVKPMLSNGVQNYYRRLAGSLRNVDQKVPSPSKEEIAKRELKLTSFIGPVIPAHQYFHVPPQIQHEVTEQELEELRLIAEEGDAVALFKAVIIDNNTKKLTPNQVTIIRSIHQRTLAKHNLPVLKDDFLLSLHLDARMLASNKKELPKDIRQDSTLLLADEKNKRYHYFLDLCGTQPREARIRIPLVVSKKMAARIAQGDINWGALTLELSANQVGVRLVVGKEPPALKPRTKAFVGRDFGYTNTISLALVLSEEEVALDAFRKAIAHIDDEKSAQAFLEQYALSTEPLILERVQFSGKKFLKKLQTLSEKIDKCRSILDIEYPKLEALKAKITQDLELPEDASLTKEHKKLSKDVAAFFQLFGRIKDVKKAQRKHYAKMAAIKKHWFGFLSTQELRLAEKYDAAIVREDLTVVTQEKESSTYKGRAFNKMINHGAKGQYQRRSSSKLRFNGVEELIIPSWYTSRACLKHRTILAKNKRQGERIQLTCCGCEDHADLHAAQTIACYPMLQNQRIAAQVAIREKL